MIFADCFRLLRGVGVQHGWARQCVPHTMVGCASFACAWVAQEYGVYSGYMLLYGIITVRDPNIDPNILFNFQYGSVWGNPRRDTPQVQNFKQVPCCPGRIAVT